MLSNTSYHLLLCTTAEAVRLGVRYRRWASKTRMTGPPDKTNLTIASAVWIECNNATDR